MDGTMAAVVLALSLIDMGINDCPTGCLQKAGTEPRIALSTGAVMFQDETDGAEVYLRRDFGVTWGPFQPTVGVSVASGGAAWIGAGVLYTIEGKDGGAYFQGTIMPRPLRRKGDGTTSTARSSSAQGSRSATRRAQASATASPLTTARTRTSTMRTRGSRRSSSACPGPCEARAAQIPLTRAPHRSPSIDVPRSVITTRPTEPRL